jgi:hypothetical protein
MKIVLTILACLNCLLMMACVGVILQGQLTQFQFAFISGTFCLAGLLVLALVQRIDGNSRVILPSNI